MYLVWRLGYRGLMTVVVTREVLIIMMFSDWV